MASKPNLAVNAAALRDFMSLPQPEDKVQVSYVYFGSKKNSTKFKCRTLNFVPQTVEQVPDWAGGYRTTDEKGGLASVETILKPVALYNDPFRRGNNKLVLCQMLHYDGTPVPFNSRASCAAAMDKVMEQHEPWFGIEQEYQLMDPSARGSWPLGWPADGFPEFGLFEFAYGCGTNIAFGRDVCEAHYRACLYAGIPIAGVNSETTPGQWEYQVGPTAGVALADHIWMARHILCRMSEHFNVVVTFDPLPVPRWTGSGAHTNYSTKQTRDKATGMHAIQQMIEKLRVTHDKHKLVYDLNGGKDNERRLTDGFANVCKMDPFTAAVGQKNVCIRIPQQVAVDGCGYIEDRRPASNCDPYAVLEALVRSTLLSD